MSNASDFIIENGVLKRYVGPGGDVVIPDGVERIGDYCRFENCWRINSVYIPDGVTRIGLSSFEGCTVKQLRVPETLVETRFKSFHEVGNEIKIFSFESEKCQCEGHLEVVCSDKLLEVMWEGMDAEWKRAISFYQLCRNGENGTAFAPIVASYIKKNKKKIIEYIFEQDSAVAMQSLLSMGKVVPLKTLDQHIAEANGRVELTAFLLRYKKEHYPVEKVEAIVAEIVEKELGFKERSVADWREIYTFKLKDGMAYISAYKGDDAVVIVPERIGPHNVQLVKSVFASNTSIECVEILPKIELIAQSCFSGCRKLEKVILPDSVKEVGGYAFQACSELATVVLPEGVNTIGEWAFSFGSKLDTIVIPSTVKSIGDNAFYMSLGLKTLTISPKTKLGKKVFAGCKGLADERGFVIVNGTLFDADYDIIGVNKENLETLTLPEGVVVIDEDAMEYCLSKNIVLPDGVKIIKNHAFNYCKRMENIYIPMSVKIIRKNAFKDCPNLTIHAPVGSYAEKYAKENNIPFVAE